MNFLYRIVALGGGNNLFTWSSPMPEENCLKVLTNYSVSYGITSFTLVPCTDSHKDGIKKGVIENRIPVIIKDYSVPPKHLHRNCPSCKC